MQKSSPYLLVGLLLTVLGSVGFSTKAIFVKLAYSESHIDALSLLALRMGFALPVFVGTAWVASSQSSNVKFTKLQWGYVVLMGCLGYYVSSLLDFMGLEYISASIELLVLFTYPTFVVLISSILLKRRINKRQQIALACTYLGLLIVFWGQQSAVGPLDKNFFIGCALTFMCAITFATYMVGSSRIIAVAGSIKFTSYAMSFAAIGVLIHTFLAGKKSLLNLPGSAYYFGFLMAIFSTIIPSYMRSEGIKRIGPENASIIACTGPISTIWLASIFLGEPIYTLQLVGMVFILTGIMLLSWKARKGLS